MPLLISTSSRPWRAILTGIMTREILNLEMCLSRQTRCKTVGRAKEFHKKMFALTYCLQSCLDSAPINCLLRIMIPVVSKFKAGDRAGASMVPGSFEII